MKSVHACHNLRDHKYWEGLIPLIREEFSGDNKMIATGLLNCALYEKTTEDDEQILKVLSKYTIPEIEIFVNKIMRRLDEVTFGY